MLKVTTRDIVFWSLPLSCVPQSIDPTTVVLKEVADDSMSLLEWPQIVDTLISGTSDTWIENVFPELVCTTLHWSTVAVATAELAIPVMKMNVKRVLKEDENFMIIFYCEVLE